MKLVLFSGLPGTGKSLLAEHAAGWLGCPVFSKDLEATLLRSGVPAEAAAWSGYDLLTTLAEEQLRLGQSAILDSVAAFERIRLRWVAMAEAHGAQLRVVECVCSNEALHRARLEARQRNIPGWHELTWNDVEAATSRYEPWSSERLVLDAIQPVDENLHLLKDYMNA